MSRLTPPAGRPGASVALSSSNPQSRQLHGTQLHGGQPHLARSLSNRHIQLIAIGGAIGTGLFMGSGKTISLAGPSVIFVYMIIGFMLFFVMRAMGELLLSNLEYKSFSDFAGDLLGPWASFFTSWTYWLCWIVTAIAELIAIALYASFWWPDLPLWIPALAAVLVLLAFNLTSVKAFGETEFWFALIKIVAIVTLIVVGLVQVSATCGTTAECSPPVRWGSSPVSSSLSSRSSVSSSWAPRPRKRSTRRRTFPRPSTPFPFASCCFTFWP
jgi:amino acid permease